MHQDNQIVHIQDWKLNRFEMTAFNEEVGIKVRFYPKTTVGEFYCRVEWYEELNPPVELVSDTGACQELIDEAYTYIKPYLDQESLTIQ